MCLGSTASENDSVNDLPRLKNGEKSIDHLRIDRLVDQFKSLFNKESKYFLGFEILDKQITIETEYGKGIIDFTMKDLNDPDDPIILVDLKLSKGDYFYNENNYDHLQQGYYELLYRDKYKYDGPLYSVMFICDYSDPISIEVRRVEAYDATLDQIRDAFLTVSEEIANDEFSKTVGPDCKACPLKEGCDAYDQDAPVINFTSVIF